MFEKTENKQKEAGIGPFKIKKCARLKTSQGWVEWKIAISCKVSIEWCMATIEICRLLLSNVGYRRVITDVWLPLSNVGYRRMITDVWLLLNDVWFPHV